EVDHVPAFGAQFAASAGHDEGGRFNDGACCGGKMHDRGWNVGGAKLTMWREGRRSERRGGDRCVLAGSRAVKRNEGSLRSRSPYRCMDIQRSAANVAAADRLCLYIITLNAGSGAMLAAWLVRS